MIENLLDVSRLEAGVMEYELKSQNLTPLIQRRRRVRDPAQEKGIYIRCTLPMLRWRRSATATGSSSGGEPGRQRGQVLPAILYRRSPRLERPEAQKFVPSRWHDRILAAIGGDGLVIVEVADRGPGVPDSEKTRIFEKFHQVKRGAKLPGQGAGLGLAICRAIMEAHGGAIWVKDNPDGGSIFRFLIPTGTGGGVTRRRASPVM